MCKATCPFAAALFGSIAGSASGASVGAISGWLLWAANTGSGGHDPQGVALLIFGTLGMGIGGSGGAVGGMAEGWSLGEGKGPVEWQAAKWGAVLGTLWGLQPILWLALTTDGRSLWVHGLEITLAVSVPGAVASLVGAVAARRMVRAFGLAQVSAIQSGKNH